MVDNLPKSELINDPTSGAQTDSPVTGEPSRLITRTQFTFNWIAGGGVETLRRETSRVIAKLPKVSRQFGRIGDWFPLQKIPLTTRVACHSPVSDTLRCYWIIWERKKKSRFSNSQPAELGLPNPPRLLGHKSPMMMQRRNSWIILDSLDLREELPLPT